MKLRNKSNTIISIGTKVLMPGDEVKINATEAEIPAIKAMVAHGDFEIDDTEERIAAAAEAARKESERKAAEEAKKAEQKAAEENKAKAETQVNTESTATASATSAAHTKPASTQRRVTTNTASK